MAACWGSLSPPVFELLPSAALIVGNSEGKQGVVTLRLAPSATRNRPCPEMCAPGQGRGLECPAHTEASSKESFCPWARSPLQFLSSLARAKPAQQEQEKRPGALWQE